MFEIHGLQQLNDSVAKLIEHDALIQAIEGVGAVRVHDEDILETAQTANALAQKALEASQVANDMAAQSLGAMLDSNIIAVVAVCVSCFVALLTLVASAYIYYRQEKIIKKQLSVAEAQNNIALFDRRYEIFAFFKDFLELILNLNDDIERIRKHASAHKSSDSILGNDIDFKRNTLIMRYIISLYNIHINKQAFCLIKINTKEDYKNFKNAYGDCSLQISQKMKRIHYIFTLSKQDSMYLNKISDTFAEVAGLYGKGVVFEEFIKPILFLQELAKDKKLVTNMKAQLNLHNNDKD